VQRAPSGVNRSSGGQYYARSTSRGYYGGSRGYVAPRAYSYRPYYNGYYGGGYYGGRYYSGGYYGAGVYLGLTLPFGYVYPYDYDYGYGYGYAAPPVVVAPQTCSPGAYDRYGNWIPNPNCYSSQQQYAQPQQNYNPQQYNPDQQQYYDSNQQQYTEPQQNYVPNQRQ
jgi:hypothetical protein